MFEKIPPPYTFQRNARQKRTDFTKGPRQGLFSPSFSRYKNTVFIIIIFSKCTIFGFEGSSLKRKRGDTFDGSVVRVRIVMQLGDG